MSVDRFYDPLAPYYHLMYADWEGSIRLQAEQIDSVIRELWPGRVRSVLDAACGIGTQTIGLAGLGYQVTASDISEAPLVRARREAEARGLSIRFGQGDFRTLSASHPGPFDLVIACDNAIPHLLTDDEIRGAFREMHRCTAPGGGALISVRDYNPAESAGTKLVPYGVRSENGRRYVVFQVWDFDGPVYDLSLYIVEDAGRAECATHVMRSRYYAIPVARVVELMTEAGFHSVRRIDGRFFQPLVAGLKAG